jgi:hypothetical protein
MSGVLAISSGNSLYIARYLLQDPCEGPESAMVERVVGNLGKSGMAMLISPERPRVRAASHDYSLVNHHSFDGSEEDCFQHTSLHMSFTEWQLPIDVGSRGIRDVEAYYVEAAIGVYDGKEWVADVDILEVFRHKLSRIIPKCKFRHNTALPKEELCKFVAIDSWEELLDSPPEIGIVRAHKNWQARLASAALSIQLGHETRILPDQVCWACCVALDPIPQSRAREENQQVTANDDEEVIGIPTEPVDEECSDSEMDEVVEREINRCKKRKIDEVDLMTDNKRNSGVHTLNRNVVYIL